MQFPNVPPTTENVTMFVTTLLDECKVVGLFFRNKVQRPKSDREGLLVVAGPDANTSVRDCSNFDLQVVAPINTDTLPLLPSKVSQIVTEGFEPWFWIAEQLANHPVTHVMAGPFKQEAKAAVADELNKSVRPPVVIVENTDVVAPNLLEAVTAAMSGMDDTAHLLVFTGQDKRACITAARIERATLMEDIKKAKQSIGIPVGLVVTGANRTEGLSCVFGFVTGIRGMTESVREAGMKLAKQLISKHQESCA